MAQFQELTRCLLAAGGATHPEGKGIYLLYTDRSALISKHWTGTSFGDQDLIATAVRPNSPASYIYTPVGRLIIYVSASSTIRAVRYDEEEEEWVEDDTIPRHEVHSEGNLAAFISEDEHRYVFFQDPSRRLIALDDSWTPTVIPADPVAGSPISTTLFQNKIHVFYISAKDNCVHYVIKEDGGRWSERIMARCAVEEKVKRVMAAPNEETKAFEAYLLTEGDIVLRITAEGEGEKRDLGKVTEDGIFVAGTSAEFCKYVWIPVCYIARPVSFWSYCW